MSKKILMVLPVLFVSGALAACASRVETPEGGARAAVRGTDDGVRARADWHEYDPDRRGNWDIDVND